MVRYSGNPIDDNDETFAFPSWLKTVLIIIAIVLVLNAIMLAWTGARFATAF